MFEDVPRSDLADGTAWVPAEIVPPPEDLIFHQPGGSDDVAPGRWDALTIERGGRTVRRLLFVMRSNT